ncbi:hypothetical protein NEOLEDRAFT_491203 [Neolentinus lepideus HHB14362 ss-1]|uniref:Uncharacterized protein n=1 Tax=Neolentinus lepideus HHB14362 ss-1 TaxID=1314782 RepID=A0A165VPC2_9AGAM|nr:hypothetical protein NEOLEDRAFT_491203 [Neolentinus lepideus HHB14362 ss-1]
MDKHLARFHLIHPSGRSNSEHDGDTLKLAVSHPRFSVRMPYNPSVLVHPYTWQGSLYVAASFAEGYMGSISEEEKCLERMLDSEGDGKAAEGAPVISFMNELVGVLDRAAGSIQIDTAEERPVSKTSRRMSGLRRLNVSQIFGRLVEAWGHFRSRNLRSAVH